MTGQEWRPCAESRRSLAEIADIIESQFKTPSVPPAWDDLSDDDWRAVVAALRR